MVSQKIINGFVVSKIRCLGDKPPLYLLLLVQGFTMLRAVSALGQHLEQHSDAAEVVQTIPPRPLKSVTPEYPREALENHIEAVVELALYIDDAGQVVRSEIVTPARDSRFPFDHNAQRAYEQASFSPALENGIPVPAKIRVRHAYSIVLTKPELKKFVEATYPKGALREGIEDTVTATLKLNESGDVVEVKITGPPVHPEYGFESSAVLAMKQFSFIPATRNGVPIAVDVVYLYQFVLPEKWAPPSESPVNLRMEILEKGTRRPVECGNISLKLGNQPPIEEAFEHGVYEGRGLEAGEWDVVIQADGYELVSTRETLMDGKLVRATYSIQRKQYDVLNAGNLSQENGDLVYETRENRFEKEVSVQKLEVAKIQRVPGNNGDAIKVVQNLPGVSRSTFNSGAVIIRGSGPADSVVLFDGAPIPMMYHFSGLSSTVNSDALSGIIFIPGNFSVIYGRAMGGVIDAKLRAPKTDRPGGYVDIDLFDGSFFLEGPLTKKLSFMVSARRSWVDSIIKLLPEDEDGDMNMTTAPRYWDYHARLHWQNSSHTNTAPKHAVDIMLYGSDDRLLFEETASANPNDAWRMEMNTAFHNVKFKWHFGESNIHNNLIYDVGKVRTFFVMEQQWEEKVSWNHAFRNDFTVELSKRWQLKLGVDCLFEDYRVDVKAPFRGLDEFLLGEMPLWEEMTEGSIGGRETADDLFEVPIRQKESRKRYLPAAYLSLGFKPTPRWHWTAGTRIDYDSLSDDMSIDVRGTAGYQVNPLWVLKGGVGTFHQPPEEKTISKDFGNPALNFQDSVHYSLGTEIRFPFYDPLHLDITGFYKTMDHLITRSDALVSLNGRLTSEKYDDRTNGRVYGLEFMLKHNPAHHFYGWVSYTLSRAERQDSSTDRWHLYRYDQTHILTLLGSCELPRGYRIGLRFRFVTGTPYTPLSTGVFDSDVDNYEPVRGARYSKRAPAYHQLDLRVDKDWVFEKWILTGYIDIQNVYFHRNAEFNHYSYDYSEKMYITGLPILPSLGIRGAF